MFIMLITGMRLFVLVNMFFWFCRKLTFAILGLDDAGKTTTAKGLSGGEYICCCFLLESSLLVLKIKKLLSFILMHLQSYQTCMLTYSKSI